MYRQKFLALGFLAIASISLVAAGCQSPEKTEAPSAAGSEGGSAPKADGTFASVQPILNRCTGCHGAGGKDGIDLRSHESTMRGGMSGAIVVPGDPANSVLVNALRGQKGKKQMPPKGPLPDAEIAAVEAWIQAGAKA